METEVLQGNEITCVYHGTKIDVCLQKLIQNYTNSRPQTGMWKEL